EAGSPCSGARRWWAAKGRRLLKYPLLLCRGELLGTSLNHETSRPFRALVRARARDLPASADGPCRAALVGPAADRGGSTAHLRLFPEGAPPRCRQAAGRHP